MIYLHEFGHHLHPARGEARGEHGAHLLPLVTTQLDQGLVPHIVRGGLPDFVDTECDAAHEVLKILG